MAWKKVKVICRKIFGETHFKNISLLFFPGFINLGAICKPPCVLPGVRAGRFGFREAEPGFCKKKLLKYRELYYGRKDSSKSDGPN
jgi:hypothetical protein